MRIASFLFGNTFMRDVVYSTFFIYKKQYSEILSISLKSTVLEKSNDNKVEQDTRRETTWISKRKRSTQTLFVSATPFGVFVSF